MTNKPTFSDDGKAEAEAEERKTKIANRTAELEALFREKALKAGVLTPAGHTTPPFAAKLLCLSTGALKQKSLNGKGPRRSNTPMRGFQKPYLITELARWVAEGDFSSDDV